MKGGQDHPIPHNFISSYSAKNMSEDKEGAQSLERKLALYSPYAAHTF